MDKTRVEIRNKFLGKVKTVPREMGGKNPTVYTFPDKEGNLVQVEISDNKEPVKSKVTIISK